MEILATFKEVFYEDNKLHFLVSPQNHTIADLKEADDLLGKEVIVNISTKKKKRSLDSNAYFWVLCQKIAEALKTSKDEVYLQMLEQYGQFDVMIVKPWAAERIMKEWRTARIIGEVNVDGEAGTQIMCFYGSSTYDQKEMSVLIDGVVSEAKELGIETLTPDELARMKERWTN